MEETQNDVGVIDDLELLDNGFNEAEKNAKSGKKMRSYADNLLENPQELARARAFAANNPQMARRAVALKGNVSDGVDKMSLRKKKRLVAMQNTRTSNLPEDNRSDVKIVRVSSGNGNLTLVTRPDDSKIQGWQRIQILEDHFVIFDPTIKRKNKKANNLFSKEDGISVGGDVYIHAVDEKGEIIDTGLAFVQYIFEQVELERKSAPK
jgi:hypothetical protein